MSHSLASGGSPNNDIAINGQLHSNGMPSLVESKSNLSQNSSSVKDLIGEAQELQSEINSIFAELSDINRQVKIDIDEFCHIGLQNTSSILEANRST